LLTSLADVDTICINQSDSQERSQQVQHMRHIYSRATDVICCVGQNESSEAVAYLINHVLPRLNMGVGLSTDKTKNAWQLLDNFFSLPYWKRVWII